MEIIPSVSFHLILIQCLSCEFLSSMHKKNKKCGKHGIFYDVQISWIHEKEIPSTRSEAFHKVYVQGTGVYTDRRTYTHGLSLSLTGNVNFSSSQFCTHFVLPSEF